MSMYLSSYVRTTEPVCCVYVCVCMLLWLLLLFGSGSVDVAGLCGGWIFRGMSWSLKYCRGEGVGSDMLLILVVLVLGCGG